MLKEENKALVGDRKRKTNKQINTLVTYIRIISGPSLTEPEIVQG